MHGDRLFCRSLQALRIARAPRLPIGECPSRRQVAVDRIVRRGLVGDGIGSDAAPHQFGEHLGRIAQHGDRDRPAIATRALDPGQRLVDILRLHIEVAGLQPHLDARGLAFDREQRGPRHGGSQRLRATHAAEPGGEKPFAGEIAAIVAPAELGEGLVGALHDALRADIDPRARGHLPVHHQAFAIELVEVVEGGPVRHQIGVGDQHPRRVGMGAKHADRLPRLHAQGLVAVELAQGGDDVIEALPVARGTADATIDDELMRLLRDLGIEVVHQHAQRRFGLPALGRKLRTARRSDQAGVVETRGHGGIIQYSIACEGETSHAVAPSTQAA